MPLSAVSHMVNAFLWLNMPIWLSVYDECRVRKPNVNEVEPYIVDVFIVCVRALYSCRLFISTLFSALISIRSFV